MPKAHHHGLPCPELAGYWQTWDLPGKGTLPLRCVPCEYTDVIIAFIAPDQEGVLRFAGPNMPTREDICALQQCGQRVLLSIGGGGVTVTLDSDEKVAKFSESLYQLIQELCVDGIDIDIEQGMPALGTPDVPEGTTLGLITGLDCVLGALPPNFQLTFAPETANLVGGITQYGGAWGNYLPLLLHFGDRVSRVHMQYYNSGPIIGLNHQTYEPGTVGFLVAMTDAIIEGFDIADTGVRFPGLPDWKVRIGLPATPQAAGNGYMAPELIHAAFQMLRTGNRPLGQASACPYRHFGGLMTWSIQWDAANRFAFACDNINNLRIFC